MLFETVPWIPSSKRSLFRGCDCLIVSIARPGRNIHRVEDVMREFDPHSGYPV